MSLHLNPLVRASIRNRAHTLAPLITGTADLLREGDRINDARIVTLTPPAPGDTVIPAMILPDDATEPVYKAWNRNDWVAFIRYTPAGLHYRQCTGCGAIVAPNVAHYHDETGKAHELPAPFQIETAPFTGNRVAVCQSCGWRCHYWDDWDDDVETHVCDGDA